MKLLPSSAPAPVVAEESRPTVVLVERDPYLAFLIRLHVPEARVLEIEAEASAEKVLAHDPDLVVAGIEGSQFPLADLLDGSKPPKVLAVVDGTRAARSAIPSVVDGVLARPFAPADLSRAVRGALRLGPQDEDPRAAGPTLARARAMVPPLRIGSLAVTGALEIAGGEVSSARGYVFMLAFAYATLRWVFRRPSIVADGADVAVALIVIAVTGGVTSNYLPFGLVAAASAGLTRGPRWGILGGLAIVVGSGPIIGALLDAGELALRGVVAWSSLFPLVGLTAGFAERVWHQPDTEGLNVLVEANRVLSSLYRIARTLPGGLEIGSVADATMHEIRDALGSYAGAMLLADAGSFAVVGSFGLEDPAGVFVRDPSKGMGSAIYGDRTILKAEDLHPATAEALGRYGCWLAAPMRRDGIAHGLLLAACPDHDAHAPNLLLLRRLAEEAIVAVENARLFSRVREISIDEERRRLARELHDGIAQSLTHLRYELDFVARNEAAPNTIQRDIQRLSRVVDRTAGEVRSMILGLRASVAAEGLVGSLRSYLSDLQRLGGPSITLDARGEVRLAGDVESEIFRVAQESVSNAIRHANASSITVRLELAHAGARLVVEDDGIGMRSRRPRRAGGGVGLQAMRERAELLGASLRIAPREPTGTRVTLEYGMEART